MAAEVTLHQISPYIGKMKSSMASALIKQFSRAGDNIYDPFCGSGTIALESWKMARNIVASDLSPYAVTLTRAKLFPIIDLAEAFCRIEEASGHVKTVVKEVDLRKVPKWIRRFFHPETLRETIAWCEVLKKHKEDFLLSCLLGILHHQRPGFLSYPSSHTVPYLREKKFPRELYPDLYNYRSVKDRLERKVGRALKRVPPVNEKINRVCHMFNAAEHKPDAKIQAIITSPPYMRQLDYGRDNRLRLWFLDNRDWKSLDTNISPKEADFLEMLRTCFELWQEVLSPSGKCILVIGDTYSQKYKMPLPDVIEKIAIDEVKGYSLAWKYTEEIPQNRRVRRNYRGSQHETILVLKRNEK